MGKWRIGLVQMASELGQIERNTQKLLSLTENLKPGTIDLLCLPEMVLTGYTFSSAESIEPFLEEPGLGITSRCCKDLATRLGCHVIAGYPERLIGKNDGSDVSKDDEKRLVGYNSAVLFNSKGFCGNYRKTNLFDSDKPWALPGDGFTTFDLGSPLGRVSIGICMDLNPFPSALWTSLDEGPYEIAEYVLDQNTNLLVILCAWLDSGKNLDSRWDTSTMNYWLMRLYPLWTRLKGRISKDSETIVVMCNRCGIENETRFAGTSTIFKCSQGSNDVEVIGMMTRNQEEVRIWEV